MTSSMAATKAALASGGITHCSFRCGLRMFFLACARWCCRWPARRCSTRRPCLPAFAASILRSLQAAVSRPMRSAWPRWRHRNPRSGGVRRSLRCEHTLDPFFNELLADPGNRHQTGVETIGDLTVAPCVTGLRGGSLQQDARPHQLARWMLADSDQGLQAIPFLSAQRVTTYFLTAFSLAD